jgi:molybdopterin converting factor small subunit
MRKLLILILVGFTLLQWSKFVAATTLNEAYKNQQSNVQVRGTGKVIRILDDDNQGSRHQKFVLKLSSGNTILIAHNIDLAPRINSISNGDTVQFYGEYEWSKKGGVVHWTHRDPNRYHIGGWLKHNGSVYQ